MPKANGMRGRKQRVFNLMALAIMLLALACQFCNAQNATSAPTDHHVRLAIVSTESKAAVAEDLLTVELSKNANVTLLEREQISKVLGEQALSAAGGRRDFIKLGEALGADGLVIAGIVTQGTGQLLDIRLVAVKPGVVLQEHLYPWPLTNGVEWSTRAVRQFQPFFPKLAVLQKDAVPLSVVNLRSPVRSPAANEIEHEMTQLLIHRLVSEPEIFVLERQNLRAAVFEQELQPPAEESQFWPGRFLLDGTIDQEGIDPNRMTVNARLVAHLGGTPVMIEVAGPRNDLPAIIEQLAAKVLVGLRQSPAQSQWLPLAEAGQYYEEAQWAYQWGLMHEAQEACESAWALGNHSTELACLRLRSYLGDPVFLGNGMSLNLTYDNLGDYDLRYDITSRQPDPSALPPLRRALEVFCQDSPVVFARNNKHGNEEWVGLGMSTLVRSSRTLEAFYYAAEARVGNGESLADIRNLSRQLMAMVETNISQAPRPDSFDDSIRTSLEQLQWEQGGFWFEQPEETLRMDGRLLQGGLHPKNVPWVIGWSWEDRKRVPGVLKRFVEEFCQSSNDTLRLEGLYLALARAPVDESGNFQARESELLAALWEKRRAIFNAPEYAPNEMTDMSVGGFGGPSILGRTEELLRKRYDFLPANPVHLAVQQEPFAGFKKRLREEMLRGSTNYSNRAFEELFPTDPMRYANTEVVELVPLLKVVGQKTSYGAALRELATALEARLNAPVQGAEFEKAVLEKPQRPPTSLAAEATNFDVVKFNAFKLPDIDPQFFPIIQSAIFRQGKLWCEIRCLQDHMYPTNAIVTYVGVDAATGISEAIPFPTNHGLPDPLPQHDSPQAFFEATQDSLFVSVQNRLERFRFGDKRWEVIPVPMEHGAVITASGGHIYLTMSESIMDVDPDTKNVKILASSSRRPLVNLMDGAGLFKAVYPGPDDKIYALTPKGVFIFAAATDTWVPTLLSPSEVNPYTVHLKTSGGNLWSRVRFEKDGELVDPFAIKLPHPHPPWMISGVSFQLDTPQGLVVASTGYIGYWLVPRTVIEKPADATMSATPSRVPTDTTTNNSGQVKR